MHSITVPNVNAALAEGLWWLKINGEVENSRNGPVLVSKEPVCTTYKNPCERVLFSAMRDANPFFHLMEALWMLAGHNDLAFVQQFNSNFSRYSDNGVTVPGAYGFRWREMFGRDQIDFVVRELTASPTSRRAHISMWDVVNDIPAVNTKSADVPCNHGIDFDLRGGVLNMTVYCRSNDILWGAYGANAVHFSMLQEYIACSLKVPPGVYRQISNNYHIYMGVVGSKQRMVEMASDCYGSDLYMLGHVVPTRLLYFNETVESFDIALHNFMHRPLAPGLTGFFKSIACPMYAAWSTRKQKQGTGLEEVETMQQGSDWKLACARWIHRRETNEQG